MPWLIGKRTRTKQPPKVVGIDYSNQVAQRNFVAVVIPGVAIFGSAYPKGTLKTNTTITPLNIGNSIYQSGYSANSGFSLGDNAALKLTISSGVIVSRMMVNSALNVPLFRVGTGSAGKAGDFYIRLSGNPASVVLIKANVSLILQSSNAVEYSKEIRTAWSYNASSGRARIALNGVLSSATVTNTLDNLGESVICGYDLSDGTETNPGAVSLFALSDTEMSDADLISASKNPWQIFEPEIVPLWVPISASAPQLLSPTGSTTDGWLSYPSGALYTCVDETVPDEADYTYTVTPGAYEEFTFDNAGAVSAAGGYVRYRLQAGSGRVTVELRQTTTVLETWGPHTLTGSLQAFAQPITASTTDSNDLRVRFTGNL